MRTSRRSPAIPSLLVISLSAALCSPLAHSQQATLMPIYSSQAVLQGLYAHFLPARAQTFQQQAEKLAAQTERYCRQQGSLADLRRQWQQSMLAWEALSTPAVGPVLARRSQRQIDFWPMRPELLRKAMAKEPHTLVDMETVGTPAKGLPALEYLLAAWSQPGPSETPLTSGNCRFAELVAQGIVVEARALNAKLTVMATRDWQASPEATANAMGEWVNQWLAAAEKLRWAHIEKPIRATQGADAAAPRQPVPFARLSRESNLMAWRVQWQGLLAQGQLTSAQRRVPPQAGQSVIPIEAILRGKGHLALAQRWTQALDKVGAELEGLTPESPTGALLALAQSIKAVTLLYQNEVSAALDIPIGFSDADGD